MKSGFPLKIPVLWYDHVPVPEKTAEHQGEVIGWRNTQVIVRVRDYAVLRFWKKNGLEVANPDHQRRGFRIDLESLNETPKTPKEIEVDLEK